MRDECKSDWVLLIIARIVFCLRIIRHARDIAWLTPHFLHSRIDFVNGTVNNGESHFAGWTLSVDGKASFMVWSAHQSTPKSNIYLTISLAVIVSVTEQTNATQVWHLCKANPNAIILVCKRFRFGLCVFVYSCDWAVCFGAYRRWYISYMVRGMRYI